MMSLSVFLWVSGIVFLIISRALRRFAESTENKWIKTTGMIVGYNTADLSSHVTPLVRFESEGKQVVASASAIRDKRKLPEGTKVPLEYRINRLMHGRTTYQVVLLLQNGERSDESFIPKLLVGIGICLILVGGIVFLL